MLNRAASLDPADFRTHAPTSAPGTFNISQIHRPLAIREIPSLHVPCECGKPLLGLEEEWISDPKGCALYVRGVCFDCGLQEVMYLSAPMATPQTHEERHTAQLRADVERVMAGIAALPRINHETTGPVPVPPAEEKVA